MTDHFLIKSNTFLPVFFVLERILNTSCSQEMATVATPSRNSTEARERLVRRACGILFMQASILSFRDLYGENVAPGIHHHCCFAKKLILIFLVFNPFPATITRSRWPQSWYGISDIPMASFIPKGLPPNKFLVLNLHFQSLNHVRLYYENLRMMNYLPYWVENWTELASYVRSVLRMNPRDRQ